MEQTLRSLREDVFNYVRHEVLHGVGLWNQSLVSQRADNACLRVFAIFGHALAFDVDMRSAGRQRERLQSYLASNSTSVADQIGHADATIAVSEKRQSA